MSDQERKIGYIVSVSGAAVAGILVGPDEAAMNGHDGHAGQGDAGRTLQIGTLVKISRSGRW